MASNKAELPNECVPPEQNGEQTCVFQTKIWWENEIFTSGEHCRQAEILQFIQAYFSSGHLRNAFLGWSRRFGMDCVTIQAK